MGSQSPNMGTLAAPITNTEHHPCLPTKPPKVAPGTEIIIALMGVTGAGKSYFIKEVTGNSKVEVGDGLHSHTQKVESYSFQYEGATIILVDTPGFDDTNRSDTAVLEEITDWTSETYREGQLLSGIIYLHPITHARMEGSSLRNLRKFQKLCGQKALVNVLLTTTQWSDVDPKKGEHRENELRSEDFWGRLIDRGATLQRFDGTRKSGLELIHKLMLNTPKPLDIQDQIVEQGMTLLETEAGQCINMELLAQEKKHKKEIESLEEERQEAIKAKDDEMVKIIGIIQAEFQKKLDEITGDMQWLVRQHEAEMKRREAEEKKRQEEAERREKAAQAEFQQKLDQIACSMKLLMEERKKEEEAERKRQEEAERKRQEEAEAERKRWEEAERKRQEEAEAERKRWEEAERKMQEEAKAERNRWEEAERKRKEEAERKRQEEVERKRKEGAERKRQEEVERKRQEEVERKRQEKAERKRQEEAERKRQEEAEAKRKRLEEAEAERKRWKEAERKMQEEAERREKAVQAEFQQKLDQAADSMKLLMEERKQEEEAERKRQEEAEKKREEEVERKRQEEVERKKQEEAERKRKEEAERKRWEEAVRKMQEEAEVERKRWEEAERKRQEEAEAERNRWEEAERKMKEEAEAERKRWEEAERKMQEEAKAERKRWEEAERKRKEETERHEKAAQAEFQQKLNQVTNSIKLLIEERKKEEEAERKRKENAERREKAMIAVATSDIPATIVGLLGSLSTDGRWISDINNKEEFESDTFKVKIKYKFRNFFGIQIAAKTFMELFKQGMGGTNCIDYRGVRYQGKPGPPISRGGQKFFIFSRN